MGINVTNIDHIRHRQPDAGRVEYAIRCHYGNGGVDTRSPPITPAQEAALAQASTSSGAFNPLALSVWGSWWTILPGLAVPGGSAGWQTLIRLDYAEPL